jgi:glycerol-3-phosphate cytidylyltransferase-like family protein
MGDYLVIGINSDEDLRKLKGPTVLNVEERAEIMRHCKFIDRVEADMPYTPTLETLVNVGCNFYAHGDDPCIDINGVDVT